MPIERVHFIVEEPSMEAALNVLLPKLIGVLRFGIIVFQGKHDLMKQLPARLRAFRTLPRTHKIVVVVDRDDADCEELKAKLEDIAKSARLLTRSQSVKHYVVVNRIAIEELEAWYFGDWDAVRAAYPRVDPNISEKTGFRDPDAIRGGTWEALERELRRSGDLTTKLRKVEAARTIAAHMDPSRNRSRSFQVFREAVLEMARP